MLHLTFDVFSVGDNAKAATCGKAYLLFHPENAVIKANLQNLKTDSDVAPRQVRFFVAVFCEICLFPRILN